MPRRVTRRQTQFDTVTDVRRTIVRSRVKARVSPIAAGTFARPKPRRLEVLVGPDRRKAGRPAVKKALKAAGFTVRNETGDPKEGFLLVGPRPAARRGAPGADAKFIR